MHADRCNVMRPRLERARRNPCIGMAPNCLPRPLPFSSLIPNLDTLWAAWPEGRVRARLSQPSL
jgi:hypothetical protein